MYMQWNLCSKKVLSDQISYPYNKILSAHEYDPEHNMKTDLRLQAHRVG